MQRSNQSSKTNSKAFNAEKQSVYPTNAPACNYPTGGPQPVQGRHCAHCATACTRQCEKPPKLHGHELCFPNMQTQPDPISGSPDAMTFKMYCTTCSCSADPWSWQCVITKAPHFSSAGKSCCSQKRGQICSCASRTESGIQQAFEAAERSCCWLQRWAERSSIWKQQAVVDCE